MPCSETVSQSIYISAPGLAFLSYVSLHNETTRSFSVERCPAVEIEVFIYTENRIENFL